MFDVSQTTALQKHETLVSHDKKLLLNALVDHRPCEIEVSDDLPERVNVLYQPADNKIYVRQGTEAEPLFRGLAQEIAKVHLKQKKTDLLQPCLYGIFGCVCAVQEKSAVLRDVSF